MKLLLIPVLFISVSVSAQEIEKKETSPKVDSVKIHKFERVKKKSETPKDEQKNMYRMPTAKPADVNAYSSMQSKKKDSTDYRILNSIKPDKSK